MQSIGDIKCFIEPCNFVMPTVVFISALSAAIWAFISIKSSKEIAREIARKNASIIIMEKLIDNEELKKAVTIVSMMHNDPNIDMCIYAYPSSSSHGEDRQAKKEAIFTVLNFNDLIAIGIKNKIYDELLIKEQRYNATLNLFSMMKDFIYKYRSLSMCHTFCKEFEILANRWTEQPLPRAK